MPDTLERLKAWISQRMSGGCRIMSQDECQCPLCLLDDIHAGKVQAQSNVAAHKRFIQRLLHTAFGDAELPTEDAYIAALKQRLKVASPALNLDHDEARALHRIVRAMHDGECPKCHKVHDSRRMREGAVTGWRCPNCSFLITRTEADEVFRIFAPFMERNLAIFEKWRASRDAVSDQPSIATG
jgi:hypothetical protein